MLVAVRHVKGECSRKTANVQVLCNAKLAGPPTASRASYRRKRLIRYSKTENNTLNRRDVARGKYIVVFLPR